MIVLPDKQAVLLRPRNPQQLLAVLPTAKPFSHKGNTLVAVPHRLDEVRVLANMGFKVPSPIKFHYKWAGAFTPFKAQMETAAFLTMHRRAYLLNDLGCVDAETEYLTPNGWRRIDQYNGEAVGQYWPDTGKVDFVDNPQYVKLPCDTMLRIKTKYGVDQLVSLEHRVLLTDRSGGKKETLQAAELLLQQEQWIETGKNAKSRNTIGYSKASIPAVYSVSGGSGIGLSAETLRVQIAVIADGHFPNNTNRCVVRVKKARKKERLRALLDAASIPFVEREQNTATAKDFAVFTFAAPIRLKEFDERFWNATIEELAVVRDEVLHWDGCVRSYKTIREFVSNSKKSADFVQYAFNAGGYVARIVIDARGPTYSVLIRDNSTPLQLAGTNSSGRLRAITVESSPDGFKYCFMVPSTYLILRRNGCVFATGNTGKTLSVLWAYDYLRKVGKVNKMLVVCPLSTMERTWGDELFRHFPHLDYAVLYGSADKRKKLLKQDAHVYIVNHDGVKIIANELAERDDIDIVISDEIAQAARNARTDRWKYLNEVINKQQNGKRWCWGVTGTPTPNAPTDAWAQCKLVTPSTVPTSFMRFKDMVMKQINQFLWVPRVNAMEIVHQVMQPAIRYARHECMDLPPCLFQTRHVELTQTQKDAYKDMVGKLRAQVDDGEVLAVNEAVKASKLVQIAAGVAYTTKGEELVTDASPRLAVVEEIIEEAKGKVIVFVPFVSAVRYVSEHLINAGHSVECIYGEVSAHERNRIFAAFQNTDTPRVLVAQPAAMSHGLTLTAANTIVWYAPIFSNDIYDQACARITRPGQTMSQLIVNIEGSPIEQKMYERLRTKQKMQGVLLSMVGDSRVEYVD